MEANLISYLFLDPRDKENDIAREGYVHWFFLSSKDGSGIEELITWLKENTQGQYHLRIGSGSGKTTGQYMQIYLWMKNTSEAMMLKLTL